MPGGCRSGRTGPPAGRRPRRRWESGRKRPRYAFRRRPRWKRGLPGDRPGNVQYLQELVIPVARVDVVEHRPGGVGAVGDVPGAAGQVPDQPGIDRPEGETPLLRHPAGTGNVIEDPGDLGPGEVGVRHEAGLFPDQRSEPLRFQAVAGGGGAAVLPDDGVIDRPARRTLPDDRRFPLVGDAEGGDVGGAQARILQGQGRHAGLGLPDLHGDRAPPSRAGDSAGGTPSGPRRQSTRRHRRQSPGNWSCPDRGPRERPWIPPLKMCPAQNGRRGRSDERGGYERWRNHTAAERACRRDFFRRE